MIIQVKVLNTCYLIVAITLTFVIVQVHHAVQRRQSGEAKEFFLLDHCLLKPVFINLLCLNFFLILFPFLPWPLNPVFLKAAGFFSHVSAKLPQASQTNPKQLIRVSQDSWPHQLGIGVHTYIQGSSNPCSEMPWRWHTHMIAGGWVMHLLRSDTVSGVGILALEGVNDPCSGDTSSRKSAAESDRKLDFSRLFFRLHLLHVWLQKERITRATAAVPWGDSST